MSENPLRDIDTEMAAITRSFGAASMMMLHRMPVNRGPSNQRGLRQTKPPSARQLRKMSQGQLTNYMWRTHVRGMNGVGVDAESKGISKELDRRGLVGQKQEWQGLAQVRQEHLNGQGQQNTQQQATQQQNTEQQRSQQDAATRQQEQARQNAPQQSESASLPADIAAAMTAVTAGVATADLLADAVDEHVTSLGGDPGAEGADLDSTVTQAGDLAEAGAPTEAVEAGEFGSEAVAGDLGQAMSDERSDNSSPAAENTNDNQAEAPAPAEGAAVEA